MAKAVTAPVVEPMTDEQVVSLVLAGDAARFEVLIRRHNQRIYRAVRAVMRSDEDVEDVMQQAYLNAYRHLRQFAATARFSTWLTRIAINEAFAMRRKRGVQFDGEGETERMFSVVDDKTRDPEKQASDSELREVMEQEVASLPDALRLTFVMRDVEGLSTADAATALGISEDLVKTRLHRARTLLRDNLYKRAGITVESIFAFGNARCDSVVTAVMTEILKAG
jgi:RNA polymerase sigma-70 factor (ECF subfamily)